MSIGRVCSKCKSTFRPEVTLCPTCQAPTKFKVRVRLPRGGWTTKTTSVRREAEAFLTRSQAKVQDETPLRPAGHCAPELPLTLQGIWPRYFAYVSNRNRSAIDDLGRWHHIEPALGDKPLSSITPVMVQSLLDGLQPQKERKEKLAPATRHRVFSLLRRMFNWSIKMGFYDGSNPCSKVEGVGRYDNTRFRFLSQEELQRLLQAIEADGNVKARLFIKFLLLSGRRRGETFSLEWSDIDLQRQTVRFRKTKNGKIQMVPISGAALVILLEAKLLLREGSKVFPLKSKWSIDRAWRRIRKRAGLSDFHLHDLRCSFASTACSAGVDLFTVSKLLGHSSVVITQQRYATLFDSALRSAVDLVGGLISPPKN
jgi:integrase